MSEQAVQQTRLRLEGWPLFGVFAAATIVVSLAVVGLFGTAEEGTRALLRATARISLVLFLAAYTASSLHGMLRRPETAWLVRNRRQLGVGFAFAHLIHSYAIVRLAGITGYWGDPVTLVAGGFGLVVLFALAATSFDAAVRALGPRRWKALHRFGVHYLWFVFLATYGGQAAARGDAVSIGSTLLLLAAAALRLRRFLRRRAAR